MSKAPTQKEMILSHLKRFGSIEPLLALREYGVYRLGAVIFEIKKDGHRILSSTMKAKSKITGRPVQFAIYTLQDEN